MWWGVSPALDLLDELDCGPKTDAAEGDTSKTVYDILLVGQYDGRHMLKTIGQKYRHSENISVNFYVCEPLLENIARQLLFVTLAVEPPENLGIKEKTLFFLELFGNTLLRPSTARYLNKVSKRLLNAVTDDGYAEAILPSVLLNNLKYKERDQLEVIFKYWASNDNSFDILKCWEERLRKHLGVRYDARNGVFDWDYHMRYHCYGADVLQLQEYKKFREKGISFYFEDTDPCVPNNTLASAVFPCGSKICSYGYLGDIITGPYVTFGLNCEDQDMFKKVNGRSKKSASNVCERNVMRIFHEIQHKSPFVVKTENENESFFVEVEDSSSKLKIQDISKCDAQFSQIKIKDSSEIYNSLETNNCKIIFLPTTALNDFASKEKYKNFFNMAFISHGIALKYLNPKMFEVFKPNSKIVVETPKFLLSYRKEDLEKFKTDLESLMTNCGCDLFEFYNAETDEFAKFIRK